MPQNSKEVPVKQRILNETALLLIKKGDHSLSIRNITTAAKANVAAVNYHFGSRDGLISRLLAETLDPVLAARQEFLDSIKRDDFQQQKILSGYIKSLGEAAEKSELSAADFLRLIGHCNILLSLHGFRSNSPTRRGD